VPYYRADRRDGLTTVPADNLYEDGAFCRPDDCEGETAFAETAGGAVYGAATVLGSDLELLDLSQAEFADFLEHGDAICQKFHIYETDELPDYDPCPPPSNEYLGIIEDFDVSGEVRFCRPVPVKKVGEYWLISRELALINSLCRLEHQGRFVFPECRGLPKDNSRTCQERAVRAIFDGDAGAIQKHLVDDDDYLPASPVIDFIGVDEISVSLLVRMFDVEFWKERAALGGW